MKNKIRWGSLFVLLFFLCFACAPSVAHATGWVGETIGKGETLFNFQKYPLENYSLDFYIDTSWNWLPWKWGEGIGDAVIYAIYAITNGFWLLNVYVCYFLGYVVQEAFDLDFITDLVSSMATNIQAIAGIDSSGLRATGLFPMLGKWAILFIGCYIAYLAGIKHQVTKAIRQAVILFATFTITGVFLMNVNTYLTDVNNAQKDMNNEMLQIAKTIIPNASSGSIVDAPGLPSVDEQKTHSATNAIRENLFELQIATPWRVLQFGDDSLEEIGKDRVEGLLILPPLVNDKRQKFVEADVKDNDNMNLSAQGVFTRFGMTLLTIAGNLVISFSVIVLTITMITSQIMFLLYMAFLPVAMVFALFPNTQRVLFKALQKVASALMTKMGITLILAVVFSLSHSFYTLSKDKGFIWIMFLQIAVWLTATNKVNELLSFMHLGGAETSQGARFGRMARNLMVAGVAGNVLKRTLPKGKEQKTVDTKGTSGTNTNIYPKRQPVSKRLGEKISTVQNMPRNFAEKVDTVKDSVKNAPTNAKYKAHEMRKNYEDGRLGTELKNSTERSKRAEARALEHQRKIDALRHAEAQKKERVRADLAATTPQHFDKSKLPKEQSVLRATTSQADGKRRVTVPQAKASFNDTKVVPNEKLLAKHSENTESKVSDIKVNAKQATVSFDDKLAKDGKQKRVVKQVDNFKSEEPLLKKKQIVSSDKTRTVNKTYKQTQTKLNHSPKRRGR
ncbi:type IV secretion system protein [Enterococcus faecalis]|uniref:CD3337/EF1877 family mobilome membrane protein n=1 Tax=Enterococcus faecalis TaxID=1351 RepID=UPI00045AA820|nr:type IV secretion system protein [Enterococcus faecalis]EJG4482755.1 type IV secretion system protein [Enterococcus faecalis]EKL7557595.1 type IV secretion system protein [Enterococcus faecalis]KAJ64875.1 putative membrane protein [Enterococcus faecalis MN16]